MGRRFLQAIALVHDGRIGKVEKVTCDIGGSPRSGPLKTEMVPEGLNWDMWQGQTTDVDYIKRRCHYQFRWWYEYSGGKLTDWGAHHVDIAQWAIQQNGPGQGPQTVKPVVSEHPVPMKDGSPTLDDQYNCSHSFQLQCEFPDGVEMNIVSKSKDGNGILFEGSKGRFFVSRGKIVGAPIDDLKTNPLPDDAIVKVYRGKKPTSHMQNFFDCVKSRELPISDVYTHHQALTTCHLANIALRLGRPLNWDAKTHTITGDPAANAWQGREQRKGYEIQV
jgi:predicted dehydrogenase